jgi:hypothetical protein
MESIAARLAESRRQEEEDLSRLRLAKRVVRDGSREG